MRRSAGGADKQKVDRKQNGFSRRFLESNQVADSRFWNIEVQRTCRMMLNPLTEVVIGVLVPVSIGRSQLVVDILRDRKGGNRQQQEDQSDRQTSSQPACKGC